MSTGPVNDPHLIISFAIIREQEVGRGVLLPSNLNFVPLFVNN